MRFCDNVHCEYADMDDQFEEMYYTVECNECGERITGTLLAMEAHNMTHYVKPTIYNCEVKDVC